MELRHKVWACPHLAPHKIYVCILESVGRERRGTIHVVLIWEWVWHTVEWVWWVEWSMEWVAGCTTHRGRAAAENESNVLAQSNK